MATTKISTTELTEMANKIRTRKDTMKTILDDLVKKVNAMVDNAEFQTEGSASSDLKVKVNAKKKNIEAYDAKVETYAKFLEEVRDGLKKSEGVVVINIDNVDANTQS